MNKKNNNNPNNLIELLCDAQNNNYYMYVHTQCSVGGVVASQFVHLTLIQMFESRLRDTHMTAKNLDYDIPMKLN